MSSCNISRDNPLLNDQYVPHMIDNCYSDPGGWNLPDFEDKCCSSGTVHSTDLNSTPGQCRPTIEGGYCTQIIDNVPVYYKYKQALNNNNMGPEPYRVDRTNIGKETPYTEDNDDTHRAGIDDIQELQDEFYNELMINRIMASEPTVIKRNLEKEELDIQEMEEDDLRSSKKLLKEEVLEINETNNILKILIGGLVLVGLGFIIYLIVNKQGSEGSKGSGSKIRPLGQASSKGSKGKGKGSKGKDKGSKGKSKGSKELKGPLYDIIKFLKLKS